MSASAPDVIVIGGGAAGLSATRDLTRGGLRVLLLEARPRLGGRVLTQHTAHGPIELGAEFVHGAIPEILGVAEAAGLALREIQSRSAPRQPRPDSEAPRPDLFSALDLVLEHATRTGDESFQHLVDRIDVDPEIKARSLGLVEGYHAADPGKIGVQALLDNTAADEQPGSERQFRFAAGYDGLTAALLDQAARELYAIELDTVVTAIRWERRRVVVHTATGEQRMAPRVVITVPLSLLKTGAIDFSPRLPEKEDALARLEMGSATRVSLQFEGDDWAGSHSFWGDGFLFTGEAPLPVWWVSHPPPWPVVTGWAGGRRALAFGRLNEAARIEAALEALAVAVGVEGSRLRQHLRGGHSYDWESDPLARGAYSYPGVGGRHAGDELGAAVDATLYFAGEATQSDGRNATVHGAIASGQRAAKQVLDAG
jgi:monoamine oxidase